MGEQDIMNRHTVSGPDWNASMLEIGHDMGVDDDGTPWVVEKISDAYMTANGRSWVEITLIAKLVPKASARQWSVSGEPVRNTISGQVPKG
jgi:hypothetical protein